MADPVDEPPDPDADAGAAEDRVARARMRRANIADEGDLAPKLPRGGGFKIGKGHLIKIALTASLLVMLIVVQRPCANAVSSFVTGFDGGSDKTNDKARMPKPGTVDGVPRYDTIKAPLTEAEWKTMVERQKGAGSAAGSSGSAPGASGSAGSGSAGSVGSATPGSVGSGSAAPVAAPGSAQPR